MTTINSIPPSRTQRVPPLQSGDRLTRDEFERRYEAMPEGVKAELIEGTVYVMAPVNAVFHGIPQFGLSAWLGLYWLSTPGVEGSDNTTVRLDIANDPQPDLYLRIIKSGSSVLGDDGYLNGSPELVVEVSASSASYDLGPKLNVYLRNGVREYIVQRTYDNAIDWFVLRRGIYEPLSPGSDGIYRSEVFPGLWLDSEALLRGDIPAFHRAALGGIASPEHAAFVERLNSAQKP